MADRKSKSPGYQPRTTTYSQRPSSIDGVLEAVSNPSAQTSDQLQAQANAPAESTKLDFSVDQVLSQEPDKQMSFKPAQPKPKKHKPIVKPHRHHVAIGVAAVVFMVGIVGLAAVSVSRRNSHAVAGASTLSSSLEENALEEVMPTQEEMRTYNAAPGLPRMLRIQQLGVEARIMRTSLKPNGELNVVRNIYDAGWSDVSGRPGDGQAVVIAAHIHGPTKAGIFYNLSKLSIGSQIEVERGDGRIFRYRVARTKEFTTDNINLNQALENLNQGKAGLNLVTYSGVGNNGGSPTNAFIVYAEAIY